jgi:alkylation response protein AidB-like acyl-CoA dehydrogenase
MATTNSTTAAGSFLAKLFALDRRTRHGSDPRGIRTRLTGSGDRLVLGGRKMDHEVSACDAILVTCLDARDGDPAGKVIKVVVERDRSPFDAREIDTIGLSRAAR